MDELELALTRLSETKYALTLAAWRGVKIVIIGAVMLLFIRLMKIVGRKIIDYTQDDDHSTQSEREKRAETLAHILNAAAQIFAVTIGLFMILRELGLNITPLLTGAGIAGVALGLGAQSMVKDFLNGFFILMENQFRIGDFIRVDGHEGEVEKISLRTTILRDWEGTLHIIPNGEIKAVRNLTHGWSQVKLDVPVAIKEDIGRVCSVLNDIISELRRDDRFGALLLADPEVLGVEDLTAAQVSIRVLARTKPQRQWEVAREFRRRIKEAFEAHGIRTMQPQQVTLVPPAPEKISADRGPAKS